jgi:hypothetical protein
VTKDREMGGMEVTGGENEKYSDKSHNETGTRLLVWMTD